MNLLAQLQSIGQWTPPPKPRSTKSGEANKRTILAALKEAGQPIGADELASRTGMTLENCRIICERLCKAETPLVVRSGTVKCIRYALKGMQ